MPSAEISNQPNFPYIPALDENGHIANPDEWLLGIAEEHGLDMAEMALERAYTQGLIAEPVPQEQRHRAEGEPDSTVYLKPPQGNHVAAPDWQVRAIKEERIIRDKAPAYAQPRQRVVDQTDGIFVFRGGDRRMLRKELSTTEAPEAQPLTRRQKLNERRATEQAAEEVLKAAGVKALRESYAQFEAENQKPFLAVLVAKNIAAAPSVSPEVIAQENKLKTLPVTRGDLTTNRRVLAELAELKKPRLVRALNRMVINILTKLPGHK